MAALDSVDWRTNLDPQSRSRIIGGIVGTLRRHLRPVGEEGIAELRNIATRFEEKVYLMAASQSDYLRRISLKVLTMEDKHSGLNRSELWKGYVLSGLLEVGVSSATTSSPFGARIRHSTYRPTMNFDYPNIGYVYPKIGEWILECHQSSVQHRCYKALAMVDI